MDWDGGGIWGSGEGGYLYLDSADEVDLSLSSIIFFCFLLSCTPDL